MDKKRKEVSVKMVKSRRESGDWFPAGYVPWNKGKTKETDNRIALYASKAIKGRKYHSAGYVEIYMPEHPASSRGYVFEHIVALEKKIGRYLYKHEQVHHINGIKDDNRPENIEAMTRSEHASMHMKGRQHRLGDTPWNKGLKGGKATEIAIKAWETKRKKNKEV
jgi:hypothetical protein